MASGKWKLRQAEGGRTMAGRVIEGWTVNVEFTGNAVSKVRIARSKGLPVLAGITDALLQAVDLAELRVAHRQQVDEARSRLAAGETVTISVPTPRGRPRGTLRLMEHALLAWAYVSAMDAGARDPSAQVARESGLGYSAGEVSQRLNSARRLGLLTPTSPGKRGGQLTAEGQALVERAWDIYASVATLPDGMRPVEDPDGSASIFEVLRWWDRTIGIDPPDTSWVLKERRWAWGSWHDPQVGASDHAWRKGPVGRGMVALCGYDPGTDPKAGAAFHESTRWPCSRCVRAAGGQTAWGIVAGQVHGKKEAGS